MATNRVVVNPKGVQDVGKEAAEVALKRTGTKVLNLARRNAPVDQGRLRASLAMGPIRRDGMGYSMRVGSNLEYSKYVHEGTGIYGPRGRPITPRRGRFLRWPARGGATGSSGGYIYARQVRGMRGRPYLADALRAVRGTV